MFFKPTSILPLAAGVGILLFAGSANASICSKSLVHPQKYGWFNWNQGAKNEWPFIHGRTDMNEATSTLFISVFHMRSSAKLKLEKDYHPEPDSDWFFKNGLDLKSVEGALNWQSSNGVDLNDPAGWNYLDIPYLLVSDKIIPMNSLYGLPLFAMIAKDKVVVIDPLNSKIYQTYSYDHPQALSDLLRSPQNGFTSFGELRYGEVTIERFGLASDNNLTLTRLNVKIPPREGSSLPGVEGSLRLKKD